MSFAAHSSDQIFKFGRNDLQPVAQKLCPDISQALECLYAQGLQGRMTGSGSAVFACIPADFSAVIETNACFPGLPDQWQARPCSNLEKHPLAGW
jgi:4-diphosphocytidyl-2-C-methyl-D-erythritol kinase